MTNIQRVGMINSNNTQKNSDYDFTKLWKWALGNKGGIENRNQFTFDTSSKTLSAGNGIATAYILCTRPTSNPIPNEQFLAQFEFTGSLNFLNITNGDKIFIEIKENLVNDPTLIEDLDTQTNYSQGLGIGEIKMAREYPNHTNYLKLYEWNNGLVDKREIISIPELDSVAQRTSTLEGKVQTQEQKVSKLEEAAIPTYIGKIATVGESYQVGDAMFERGGVIVKRYPSLVVGNISNFGSYGELEVGQYTPEQGDTITIEIGNIELGSGVSGTLYFADAYYHVQSNYNTIKIYGSTYIRYDIGGKRKITLQGYTGGPIYVTRAYNGSYGTANINNIKIISRRVGYQPDLYPREVKGVGERVECTIMGLHSNGDIIQPKPIEIVLGKEMSGTFTTTREAPNSGYLELTYKTGSSDSQYGWVNIGEVWLNASRDNRTERIFVQKGPIVFKGGGREGYAINTYLKLEKFTSVM